VRRLATIEPSTGTYTIRLHAVQGDTDARASVSSIVN
jgi:hypothetical protein